jgi:hypothetical protein
MCAAMFCLVVSALTNAVGCCCMRIRLLITASVLAFGGSKCDLDLTSTIKHG